MEKSENVVLERRRVGLINELSAHLKFISEFVESTVAYQAIDIRQDQIRNTIKQFEEVQAKIEDLDDREDDCQSQHRIEFNELACNVQASLLALLAKKKKPLSSSNQIYTNDTMRLPAVPAPTFDGNLQNWPAFRDSFDAMFHNNKSLADVQKLHYLKSCLTNSANDVIKSFPTTGDNYQRAYDALIMRYENKSLTIQSHIRSLLETPKVITATATELQKLLHHVSSHVKALEALQQPINSWDAWLVTLICYKLDNTTVGEWQIRQSTKELPKFVELETFLSNRISAYEVGDFNSVAESRRRPIPKKALIAKKLDQSKWGVPSCIICREPHKLYLCQKFNDMKVSERREIVANHKLCFNCMLPGHQASECRFSNCKKCDKKHNTKLHYNQSTQSEKGDDSDVEAAVSSKVLHVRTNKENVLEKSYCHAMLATAIININDASGQPRQCRAILDSGSQISFMTRACAMKLQLKNINASTSIAGIGSTSLKVIRLTPAIVSSCTSEYVTALTFHCINVITSDLPSCKVNIKELDIPNSIRQQLADPQFHKPSSIDCLLGADIFYEIFHGERITISSNLAAHSTTFGWIITGQIYDEPQEVTCTSLVTHEAGCQSAVALHVTKSNSRAIEECYAENHFVSTVTRDDSGRFVVRLPFSQDPAVLGDSRYMAVKRFINLERRLQKEPLLASEYKTFMREYLDLGHMEKAEECNDKPAYYLPHHAVLKADSLTTKVRVVFDGSACARSGLSLNDILHRGPKIQHDIISIILRFRTHAIALTADVAKMYRQVLMHPDDRNVQRIVYRELPDEPLQEFKLCTVTYGTKPASFLATRCLLQLAQETKDLSVKRTIAEDFYVDDLVSGGATEDYCYTLHQTLSSIFQSAGFPLRKWCSNSTRLMSQIPTAENDPAYRLTLTDQEMMSALGLRWQPSTDTFHFELGECTSAAKITKRTLLSEISRIYDPVGFISPVLIKGKIFIQQLWALKLNWDTILPEDLQQRWKLFYSSLSELCQLTIPRHIFSKTWSRLQLHGFCDASLEAFGACIYVCSQNEAELPRTCRLYVSKSRVAPMRSTTIPRLELCGAVLLAELMADVKTEFKRLDINIHESDIFLWSDSSVVISWINCRQPLKSYVANRVAQILDSSNREQWYHVPTSCNPADLISRGMTVSSLHQSSLWWCGPTWLSLERDMWPAQQVSTEEVPELRPIKLALVITAPTDNEMLSKYSEWLPLVRITSFILRFRNNSLSLKTQQSRQTGPLTVSEIEEAKLVWLRQAQVVSFPDELAALSKGNLVSSKSKLKLLNPFLDSRHIIRVGGRLSNSSLTENAKFPIVLPSHHKITQLLFKHEHIQLLHAGPQALLSHMHLSYWPLRGRNLSRITVHKCITCFRHKPTTMQPFMANLPRARVTVERPFARTGIDFCGPIHVKSGVRRVTSIKSYIAVFVCLVTRAIHLELVSNLSTEAFLAALHRFMSRRGMCSHIYSDNGTNFVGANKDLTDMFKKQEGKSLIEDTLSSQGIQWHFICPAAPHHGGIWEAAVKSAKTHLYKICHSALLNFEEIATLLCRIEMVLNSRPLTPVSLDPSDHEALTPNHFLIGGPGLLPPEPDMAAVPENRLKRFDLIKAKAQLFWSRWSKEYLPQLQKRGKWIKPCRNLAVGDLAVLREDNIPPLKWKLVRITQTHPGADGITRVVTVRTPSKTTMKRPVTKLALLPTVEDEQDVGAPVHQ